MIVLLQAVLLALCVSVSVHCRPQNYGDAKIERNEFTLENNGNFYFRVDTSDGFHHDAVGYQRNIGAEEESQVVKGTYSYTGPDGVVYAVSYVADENGFQPYGDHIPQFKIPLPPTLGAPIGDACIGSLCGTGIG